MNPDTLEHLRRLFGDDLDGGVEGPVVLGLDQVPDGPSGVYILEDVEGRCAYVGSVCSRLDEGRLARRIEEHRRDPRKLNAFQRLYFVPVRRSSTCQRVEALEGLVSDHLRPYMGRRRPDPSRRRSM